VSIFAAHYQTQHNHRSSVLINEPLTIILVLNWYFRFLDTLLVPHRLVASEFFRIIFNTVICQMFSNLLHFSSNTQHSCNQDSLLLSYYIIYSILVQMIKINVSLLKNKSLSSCHTQIYGPSEILDKPKNLLLRTSK
jgi:hypothetical protein